MSDHMLVLVLAVGGLVAFLIYKGTMAVRAAREEKIRGRRVLGFEPVASPPPEVAGPLLALFQRGKKSTHRITELYERRGSEDRLFLFDMKDSSGDSSREDTVAVFSPRLHLPRFSFFPRLEGEGGLNALGNLLLKKLGGRHGGVLDFPAHPRFAKRYFVSASDEEAVRRFLTDRRLDALAEIGHVALEAEGDRFAFQEFQFGRQKKEEDRVAVARRVERAEELLRVLEG